MTVPTPRDVASGRAWSIFSEHVARAGRLVWGEDGTEDNPTAAEGMRYLLRFLAAGISVCIEHDDTVTPELGRMIEDRMSWGLDNPDTLYTYAGISGEGHYRLVGRRGTACHVEVQVNTGHYSDGDFTGWRTISALPGTEIACDADGRFEVALSRTPTGSPNWLRLDDDAGFLLIRQYFADWDHEEPWDLAIERLDAPLPAPVLTDEVMAARLARLCDWLDVGLGCWQAISEGIRGAPTGDIEPFVPPAEASGLKGLAYGMAPWRCGPDEAVVLELDPPDCLMWGFSLCDRYWQSIDFADRQSSLNSSQATLTADGRFVGVICHGDPGLANWLDPGAETEGTVAVRYLMPEGIPPVRYRTVPRTDLDASLPAGVPRISREDRAQVLARRHLAVARRYRR